MSLEEYQLKAGKFCLEYLEEIITKYSAVTVICVCKFL